MALRDLTDSRGHPTVPYLTLSIQLNGKSARQVWTTFSTEQRASMSLIFEPNLSIGCVPTFGSVIIILGRVHHCGGASYFCLLQKQESWKRHL
ncbi:hypothetical protein AFLA_005762 [Aspergillus flavus NRRL3357]|nr:hypothetical protein AFLA_005762 [Aspergillus flavus NRRL3357]